MCAVLPAHNPCTLAQLTRWLGSILWVDEGSTMDVFRVKGVADVAGSEAKHIVQGVHELFEVTPSGESWAAGEERCTKVRGCAAAAHSLRAGAVHVCNATFVHAHRVHALPTMAWPG